MHALVALTCNRRLTEAFFCPAVLPCALLQLETAATAGVVLVIGLIALLAAEAINSRFPAIQDGSLPLWSLKVDGHLPEAFAVVGYAFYMQVCAARGFACELLGVQGRHAARTRLIGQGRLKRSVPASCRACAESPGLVRKH